MVCTLVAKTTCGGSNVRCGRVGGRAEMERLDGAVPGPLGGRTQRVFPVPAPVFDDLADITEEAVLRVARTGTRVDCEYTKAR